MDPDQTARMRWLVWIHAGRKRWSGSMLVANLLYWFCRDVAQMSPHITVIKGIARLSQHISVYHVG
jgi:hypothetical protein